MEEIIVLGIIGSLRKTSYNRYMLQAAQTLMPEGATLKLFELQGIPLFNQDNELTMPQTVRELKRRILAADAILFGTPEYNYSLPGVLKNAIDWASRPFGESAWVGKPAALMGASTDRMGTVRAQHHLRQILVAQDMPVINRPEVMIANAAQQFDENGRLHDTQTRQRIQKQLVSLVNLARQVAQGVTDAGRDRGGIPFIDDLAH